MKEESRRLEVHKPRRDHRVTAPLWGSSQLSTAMWLHFFPQQPLVSFQLASPLAPSPISPQWWQL